MGKIGTEVAKDAADIVLLDDNLSSIVAAIAEGRHMYKNIQKSLLFLFSTSLGELFAITAALFLHMPMPVLAAQILWLNLVTDPLIGTALALEKKEAGLLHSNFQKQPKYFMTRSMLLQMPILGAAMAGAALYLFNLYYGVDYFKGITIALTTLAVAQWYNGFNCQSDRESIFSGRFFKNPYLILAVLANLGLQLLAIYHPFFQKILKTVPLSGGEWAAILGVAFVVILAEEIRKLVYNFKLHISKIRE
jgi:Ca2+-transporting ATPase